MPAIFFNLSATKLSAGLPSSPCSGSVSPYAHAELSYILHAMKLSAGSAELPLFWPVSRGAVGWVCRACAVCGRTASVWFFRYLLWEEHQA